jgi:hypothetical protein
MESTRPDVLRTISPVVYRPETLRLSEGTVVPIGDTGVALQHANGWFVSVHADGRVDTCDTIGPCERATRVGATLLRYAETGTEYYLVVQAR